MGAYNLGWGDGAEADAYGGMSDSDRCFGEKWSRKKELGGAGGGMLHAQLCKCLNWASLYAISQKSVTFEDLNLL